MDSVYNFASILGNAIGRWPWRFVLLCALISAVLLPGVRFLKFNDDYRVYFSPENPDLRTWEQMLDTYTRADGVTVVVSSKTGENVFTPEVMTAVSELTEQLWYVPFVVRVDSVTNFQHIIPSADEITVVDLVPKREAGNRQYLAQHEKIAQLEPQIDGLMLSKDAKVTAIYLQMMIPKVDNAIADATAHLHKIVSKVESDHPNINVKLGGLVMLNSAFDEYARKDMGTLFPGMVVVILVIMIVLLRSASFSGMLMLTMFLSIGMAMGGAGYLGIVFSPHSSIAPQVMMVVAIATGIHVALSLQRTFAVSGDKRQAVVATFRSNFLPISLTSLTTIVAFASMLLSNVPPFRDLGIMCGLGMLVTYFMMMVFLPALFVILPVRANRQIYGHDASWPGKLGAFVIRSHKRVLLATLVIAIPVGVGLSQLKIDDHPVRLFAKSTEFRKTADYIDEHLAGTTSIEFSLDAGGNDEISDPDFMRRVEGFKQYLSEDPMVRHVSVITDTVKRINRAMHGGDDSYYRLPDNKVETAQYLLFYEMNLPFGLDLNNQINISKSSVRLIATVKSSSSSEISAFLDRTHAWMDLNNPSMKTHGASVLVMFARMNDYLANNMMSSAALGLVSIAIILMLIFRSWKIGLLSMVPNLLPILVVFGLWSLMGNTLDFATSLIFSMTFGIVVDDTVHFLSKFLDAIRHGAESAEAAILESFKYVGPATIYSSVILIGGFLVFGLSNFHMNVTLGVLSALTFLVAMLADIFLLPALLMLVFPGRLTTPTAAVDAHGQLDPRAVAAREHV